MWRRVDDTEGTTEHDPLRARYRVQRRLLAANSELLELMADLEVTLDLMDAGQHEVRVAIRNLLDGTLLLAENLNLLTGNAHPALYDAHHEIERELRAYLRSLPSPASQPLIFSLTDVGADRVREVGGKAANLGQLRAAMPEVVPPGFVITTAAYRWFLAHNSLHEPIRKLLQDLSLVTGRSLFRERTAAIRTLVTASPLPEPVSAAIAAGVRELALPRGTLWAVRSSAVGEDGRMSFAGQFDSVLGVPEEELASAYRGVLASRYNDRAVHYRLVAGFAEVETPMAVLFLPMLDARAGGVLYTRDPGNPDGDTLFIDAVPGLADAMVRGEAAACSIRVERSDPSRFEVLGTTAVTPPLDTAELGELVAVGLRVEAHFGRQQDIEWVLTRDGKMQVVQARPLRVEDREPLGAQSVESRPPVLRGGLTIVPGRAVGPAYPADTLDELAAVQDGAIRVVRQATPELAAALPHLAGVIAEHGNPAGHAANLIREFAVPAVFGVAGAFDQLQAGRPVSLDATARQVFDGTLWPEVRERVRSRLRHVRGDRPRSPLHERVLTLNLVDPLAMSFRARGCRSLHDIVRFTHEKAVAAMFALGDEAGRQGARRVRRLATEVPLNLAVLDLGGALPAAGRRAREVRPDEIASVPFQALWRGMTRPGVKWTGRTAVSVAGFASVVTSSMSDAWASVRGLGERNYVMVAPDYLNLNARLAYHFAMVDALVCDAPENNFVNFRFRGGGAGDSWRDLRARFLAEVLLRSGFSVDRRGDLVTAWLRRFPRTVSEDALAVVGALMACARQLDMLMDGEASLRHFVERFLAADYASFG